MRSCARAAGASNSPTSANSDAGLSARLAAAAEAASEPRELRARVARSSRRRAGVDWRQFALSARRHATADAALRSRPGPFVDAPQRTREATEVRARDLLKEMSPVPRKTSSRRPPHAPAADLADAAARARERGVGAGIDDVEMMAARMMLSVGRQR